jgi:RNA polymerase sigma-70 factor (ECF subfamily)
MPIRSYEQDFAAIDERVSNEALRTDVREALDSLPPSQRDALELRVVQELDYEQVVHSLGCSQGAARLRVVRGLSSLSRLLGKATS